MVLYYDLRDNVGQFILIISNKIKFFQKSFSRTNELLQKTLLSVQYIKIDTFIIIQKTTLL